MIHEYFSLKPMMVEKVHILMTISTYLIWLRSFLEMIRKKEKKIMRHSKTKIMVHKLAKILRTQVI